MRKNVITKYLFYSSYLYLCVGLLFFFGSSSALADVNIDSNNTTSLVGITAFGSWDSIGDSFVADVTGTVTGVDVCVYDTGGASHDVNVDIEDDSGGSPSGTPLSGGGAVPIGSISTVHQKVSTGVMSAPIVAGQTYWMVLSSLDNSQQTAACGDNTGNTGKRNLTGTGWSLFGGTISATVHTAVPTTTPPEDFVFTQSLSTTTQLTDAPTDDIFHGIVVFFLSFGFVAWLLRKK